MVVGGGVGPIQLHIQAIYKKEVKAVVMVVKPKDTEKHVLHSACNSGRLDKVLDGEECIPVDGYAAGYSYINGVLPSAGM